MQEKTKSNQKLNKSSMESEWKFLNHRSIIGDSVHRPNHKKINGKNWTNHLLKKRGRLYVGGVGIPRIQDVPGSFQLIPVLAAILQNQISMCALEVSYQAISKPLKMLRQNKSEHSFSKFSN